MTKADWEGHVPALKRNTKRAKIQHNNQKFLLCPNAYRRCNLVQVRFPPNNGDLNLIETERLAEREQEDLAAGRVLTAAMFRKRAAQLLNSYGVPAPSETYSSLSKLVRGMPARLAKCRKNKFGRCGK